MLALPFVLTETLLGLLNSEDNSCAETEFGVQGMKKSPGLSLEWPGSPSSPRFLSLPSALHSLP